MSSKFGVRLPSPGVAPSLNMMRPRGGAWWLVPMAFLLVVALGHSRVVAAPADAVTPQPATAQAGSATWITVSSPFTGDANGNSYTRYEYGTSNSGPWILACGDGTPGESAWRHCTIGGLTANTEYFVRVTFVDSDGVSGGNPQVTGPVRTGASAVMAVTVGTASATVQDTHLRVAAPTSGDADMDSRLESVDVATSLSGPWTQKCGPYASLNPKLCRVHGLTPGTDYWVRVTVGDPDGVSGSNPQVIGPIKYTGLANLALGKAITADPGWGCCPNPGHLVDGRIQNADWFYGFAWTGGTDCWAGGCPPGWKQATIDLGTAQQVSRLDWWIHNAHEIPTDWKVLVSGDGASFTEVFSTSGPVCRTATGMLNVGWAFPACKHSALFSPTTARYVRYMFDDRTLIDGIHGWSVEIEVFGLGGPVPPTNRPPTANAGGPYSVDEGGSVALAGSGSDPDADPLTYKWDLDNDNTFETAGANATFSAAGLDGPATRMVGLQVCDDKGACATDLATVSVQNIAPTITGVAGPTQALTGVEVTFTGTATDPAPADASKLTWEWTVDGKVVPGQTTNTLKYSFAGCGSHTVSAVVRDDDGGVSAPVALSGGVGVATLTVQPPLDAGVANTVQKGRVVPVKVAVECNGVRQTGLAPRIQLLNGNVSPANETSAVEVETLSSSAADTTGVMRSVDSGYMYNLQVPSEANAGAEYSIRVRPFGDSNSAAAGYVVLRIK